MPTFREVYNKPETITDRQYVMPFGKYKDLTIEFVLEHDPQYLLFCQSKIDWFDLHHTILDEIDCDINDLFENEIRSFKDDARDAIGDIGN